MNRFEYMVETGKPFEEAVAAVERLTAEKGLWVLQTHDVAATYAEKGFRREPLKIVEIFSARYASEVLRRNVRTALLLPCCITVYVAGGKTFISTLLPSVIVDFYPESGIGPVADEMEKTVLEIIHEAKR